MTPVERAGKAARPAGPAKTWLIAGLVALGIYCLVRLGTPGDLPFLAVAFAIGWAQLASP